jgi:hypothetical protein
MSTRTLTFSGADLRTKALAVDDDKLVVDAVTGEVTTGRRLHVSNGFTITQGSNIITELPKHDRPLVKYPEVVLTSTSDKGYVINRSSANSSFPVTNLFNDSLTDRWLSTVVEGDIWSGTTYIGSNYITDINGTQHPGAWIRLKMPKQIKLSYVVQRDNSSSPPASRVPAEVKILGTNDSTNFYLLKTFTGLSNVSLTTTLFVNEAQPYNEYAYVMKDTVAPEGGIDLSSLEFWGTEEGDESVDVVHKSIPNKPSQQQLAVYYEARDPNSYSFADSSNVYDLSGNGRTGTITGTNGFDAEYNAWVFDGSGDYISGTMTTTVDNWVHSISMWAYIDTSDANGTLFFAGNGAQYQAIGIRQSGKNKMYYYFFSYDVTFNYEVPQNQWVHLVFTYDGGTDAGATVGGYGVSRKFYVDCTEQTLSTTSTGQTLDLQSTSTNFSIGASSGGVEPFTGKIANVRVFSKKVLSVEQIRELYEYDAPRFGHRQNLMALHKGNLGVGVTNPTSRFEVAGADGVQEYPPKAMTGYETYMEGHGVFKVHKSGDNTFTNDWPTWEAFNEVFTDAYHGGNFYTGTDYAYAGTETLGGIIGDYVILEMPYKIKAKQISLAPYTVARICEDFMILGSNNGNDWTNLATFNGITNWTQQVHKSFDINSDEYFDHFAVVVTRLISDSYLMISEIKYFGTPAPSSLEDGHLTLGKALTLPRVSGHAAGAETPRAESLVVHYDTTVDSVVSGSTVVDISGEGNNGTLVGNATYSSTDRAVVFDGSGDYVSGELPSSVTGAWAHSVSLYFKMDTSSPSGLYTLMHIGDNNNAANIMSDILVYADGKIRFGFYDNDCDTATGLISLNTWYHILVTYTGGTGVSSRKVYINGIDVPITLVGSYSTSALNLPTDPAFYLGAQNSGAIAFDGSIANFKLWSGITLTAEEVAMEYALGRTGKSINLTDTALCIGGTVPRAQLDVRGVARCEGMYSGNTTLKFYRLSGSFAADNVNNFSVSAPVGFTKGDTIVQLTGCTKSSNGDVIPWHNDDANWKTSLYYDYTNNVIAVYSIGLTNQAKTYEILIVTI